AHGAAEAAELLRQHAHGGEVERDPAGAGLRVALQLGVVVEGDRGGAARDGLGLVRCRVCDAQAVARGHVALGVPRARLSPTRGQATVKEVLITPPEMELTPCGRGWPGAG